MIRISTRGILNLSRKHFPLSKRITAASNVEGIRCLSTSATSHFVGGKSWIPTQDVLLQKVTTQSLIHEVSMQQIESANKTIPWFLKQMPVSYFKQIPEHMRKQHIIAISAIRELQQTDLSLRIETKSESDPGNSSVTVISTDPKSGTLLSQLKSLTIPRQSFLAGVKVFSSADNQLALNIYSFRKIDESQHSLARATPNTFIVCSTTCANRIVLSRIFTLAFRTMNHCTLREAWRGISQSAPLSTSPTQKPTTF